MDLHHGKPTACSGLWGDAAPYTLRDSLYLLIFTMLSGIRREYFWIFAVTKRSCCACGCQARHTFEAVFRVIVWSLVARMAGVHPYRDHNNVPWPEGSKRADLAGKPLSIRTVLLRFFGDWAWMKQSLGLRGWRGEGPLRQIC